MIKLISIDVDGTLLDSEGILPEGNMASIHAAKDKDIRIILNTGKPIDAIINVYNALELNAPVITMTGGLILDRNGDKHWKVLKSNPFPVAAFSDIYKVVQDIKVTTYFMNKGIMYVHHSNVDDGYINNFDDTMNRFSCREYEVVSNSPLLDWANLDMPTYKIMFFSDNYADMEQTWAALNYANIEGIISEFSSPYTVDVRTAASGKKNMVEFLCGQYQINQKEVMALGDQESDMELIQWAGVGALMENSDPELKKQAPLIAPSNDACGVANFIEKYALK
ncbi:MAG: Cof-type HAD-IIB family hydrolase [Anaerolineales bacterium]|nr:Cof-type HAD-IIB family hydrolase [Anaerolineales bacterium]